MKLSLDFMSSNGEMSALVRAHDWHASVLGPAQDWPELLKITLRTLLRSPHPMFLWWGPELIQFYNDAYRQTLGPERHPSALGQTGRECWAEIWDIIGVEILSIMAGGDATWHEDQLVPVMRHGRLEEVWWTYSFSPIADSHGNVEGVLVICNDVSAEHRAKQDLISLNSQLAAQMEQLAQNERHQTFQLTLADRMGVHTDADSIARVAFEMLSAQFAVERIDFTRIDDRRDLFRLDYSWNKTEHFSIKDTEGHLAEFSAEIIAQLRKGQSVSVTDTRLLPRLRRMKASENWRHPQTIFIVPIIKEQHLIGTLSLNTQAPYAWSKPQVTMLKEVAERIRNAIERARIEAQKLQAQHALLSHQKEANQRLWQLFRQAPSFVAILDGPKHHFEFVNDAFLSLVGKRALVGRTVGAIFPEVIEQGYLALLDQVYASGQAFIARARPLKIQREAGVVAEELFVDFVYQPIFSADQTVRGIFIEGNDVTAQHLAQRRQEFMLELADCLRPLSSADSIVAAGSALLGRHLGVSRVLFAEVDDAGDRFLIRQGWSNNGIQNLTGHTQKLDDFGPEIIEILRRGQILAQEDVLSDPRTSRQAQAYAAINVRAQVAIPLIKNNGLMAVLGLHQATPRHWTTLDMQTAQDMAERTWAAVENARAQAELSVLQNQSAYIFNTMTEGCAIVDRDWTILQMNAEGLRISERGADEVLGRNHWDVFPELLNTEAAAAYARVKASGIAETIEHSYVHKNGRTTWIEIRAYPALDCGLAFFFRDVTERKVADRMIQSLAFYDPLTNLPNRRLLMDQLQRAQSVSHRSQREGALLFIDLDDFKTLNDTLGHDIGDQLLIKVAECLSSCVRTGDAVGRLGGDEFVVILENLTGTTEEGASQAEHIGTKILDSLNQIQMIGGYQHHTTASIGITLFSDALGGVEELMKRADLAMYQAKAAGRNTLRFYDARMQLAVTERSMMELALRRALVAQEFVLHFQPQVDDKGHLTGFEALVRWQHPMRGVISPAEFIPVIEQTTMILPLGLWVLNSACKKLASWVDNPKTRHLSLAVNVSARQFRQTNFVDQVLMALERSGADPFQLKLELTESVLLDDIDDAIVKMQALKAHGVRFSLDDFGIGYASLSYLKRLPFDQLKIDQSFIQNLLTDRDDTAIVKMVIELAHSMDIEVIAEGVESQGQHDVLMRHGCRAYQGYLFSLPLAQEALDRLLHQPGDTLDQRQSSTVFNMNPRWNRRSHAASVAIERRSSGARVACTERIAVR